MEISFGDVGTIRHVTVLKTQKIMMRKTSKNGRIFFRGKGEVMISILWIPPIVSIGIVIGYGWGAFSTLAQVKKKLGGRDD